MREIRFRYKCPHCRETVHIFMDAPMLLETNHERRTDVVTCYKCNKPADIGFSVRVRAIGG